MNDAEQVGQLVACDVCGRWVHTFNTEHDKRPRYKGHNATGHRAGRECDNSGELVTCGVRTGQRRT